jgi:hypothetical protein
VEPETLSSYVKEQGRRRPGEPFLGGKARSMRSFLLGALGVLILMGTVGVVSCQALVTDQSALHRPAESAPSEPR